MITAMDNELLQALAASGLGYDLLGGYGCSVDEADFIIDQIF